MYLKVMLFPPPLFDCVVLKTLGAYLFLSTFISINSHKYFDTNVVFILMTKGRIK